jgi:hypothetical protein
MFKIQDVKDFLDGFAEKEYHFNRNKFDLTIPEHKFCEDVQTFLETYFSLYYIELKTGSLMTRSLEDLDDETIEWNRNSFIKRKVYVIRHFQTAKFGSEIHADCNEVFSCFLGSDSDIVGMEVYIDNFYVGIVENKLKIISVRTLKNDPDRSAKLVWEYNKNSVEWSDNVMILNEGESIDVLRIMEPELESWKEDYFR